MSVKPNCLHSSTDAGRYSNPSDALSGMASSFRVTNSYICSFSFAPGERMTSRGAKRPSSFIMWLTASPSKAAQQNSPVDTSQNATPPSREARYTAPI